MLARYDSLTDPAYVALLTLGVAGVGLWAFGAYGHSPDSTETIEAHYEKMKKAGLYIGVGGVGLAVAYFLYQEFS